MSPCYVTVSGIRMTIHAGHFREVGETCAYPDCRKKAFSNVVWYDENHDWDKDGPRPSAPFCKEHGDEWRKRWDDALQAGMR